MTKIKKGDTVVVDLDTPLSSWHKAEGVLLEAPAGARPSKVRITKLGPHNRDHYIVGNEYLLLNLTKAPGFRVGTKALFTGTVGGFTGQTVTVTEAIMEGTFDYTVKRADGQSCPTWHRELQRIEEPVKPAPKFKVGDRVVVGQGGYASHKGKELEVMALDPEGGWHIGPVGNDRSLLHSTRGSLYYLPEEAYTISLAPKTEAPRKFVVGDRVTVKASYGPGAYVGRTGKVIDTYDETNTHVRIRFEDGKRYDVGTFTTNHVELAKTAPLKPAPKFAVGGKITKAEAVDGPAHYGGKDNPYEAIKVAEAWGFNKEAYLFNALKYLARAGKKGDKVEDLKKLVFYVEREIALEEAK